MNISFRLRAAGVKRLGAKESVAIGYRPHAEQPKEVGDGRALRVRPVTRPRAGSYPLLRGRTLRLAIANIARETGLTRATAPRRFLHTLDKPGLRGLGVRPLHLRPRVLQLSYAYLWSVTFPEILGEHLIELADRLHESCPASVLDGEG